MFHLTKADPVETPVTIPTNVARDQQFQKVLILFKNRDKTFYVMAMSYDKSRKM